MCTLLQYYMVIQQGGAVNAFPYHCVGHDKRAAYIHASKPDTSKYTNIEDKITEDRENKIRKNEIHYNT